MGKQKSKRPKSLTIDRLFKVVVNFYLASSDFNGIPIGRFISEASAPWDKIRNLLQCLIIENKVGVLGGDSGNSHIIACGFPDPTKQLATLENPDLFHTCLYPRPPFLADFISDDLYRTEPYTRELALGHGQLSFRSFDLSVLEHYRNDPRYHYHNNDISGRICVRDSYCESDEMLETDQVVLQTFGFSYDDNMNRAVAVFLRYLSDLTPEHQQIWRTKELNSSYKLHPDYYEMSVLGSWGTGVSVCDALLAELAVINAMCSAMGREHLFKKDFGKYGEQKPREFGFLIRPTCKEFNSFVLLLDKLLSENINPQFFADDISFEVEQTRKDGKIQVERKGTLTLLNDWLREMYRPDDWSYWDESYATLKEVRKLRQQPAHSLDENKFDQEYFKKQRDLLSRMYTAIRDIRLMLANHPKVKRAKIEIPSMLNERINTQ